MAVAQSKVELGLRRASIKFGNILNYGRRFRAGLPTISWKRVCGDESPAAKMGWNGAFSTIAKRARRETVEPPHGGIKIWERAVGT